MPYVRFRNTLVALAALVLAGSTHAWAQLGQPRAQVTALAGASAVRPGGEVRLALQVTLPPSAHVQSNAPRDPALIPTLVTIDAPTHAEVVEVVYPTAIDFEQAGQAQPLSVFAHEFAIGARVAIATTMPRGNVTIPGRIRYQSCDARTCYAPTTVEVAWTFTVADEATAAAQHAEVFDAIAFGTGLRPGQSSSTGGSPPSTAQTMPAAPQRGPDAADRVALDGVEVVASTGGYLDVDEFLQFVGDAERGQLPRGAFDGRGPLAILALVFVGGLALNLTPCVLPMIPINLAIIGAGAAAGSRRRGLALGSAYGAAMAAVYGVLGVIVILTTGTFGTLNASPWFNAGIAVVFAVLALAMFDVVTIDFSRFTRVRGAGAPRGSLPVAFAMGGIAALLAGACVAPVVIQVVLFASQLYGTGTSSALALPFVLGLGMALPWPIAGAGIAALPRPGAWMVRVKQGFGVLILATSLYYGYLAATLIADRWVSADDVVAAAHEKLASGWHASLAAGLDEARRTQQPVLIDLWATWCKNCLTMDATTFADARVTAALSGYVRIKVQAEDPGDAATAAVMQQLRAVGLPTYAIVRVAPPVPAR